MGPWVWVKVGRQDMDHMNPWPFRTLWSLISQKAICKGESTQKLGVHTGGFYMDIYLQPLIPRCSFRQVWKLLATCIGYKPLSAPFSVRLVGYNPGGVGHFLSWRIKHPTTPVQTIGRELKRGSISQKEFSFLQMGACVEFHDNQ